jgi:hypothetical protein
MASPNAESEMKQRVPIMWAVGLFIVLGAGAAPAQQQTFTDASGLVETAIFYGFSAPAAHPTLTIPVGGEWVVIGGGGYVDWKSHGGYGSLLTASYPTDESLQSWTIRAKDHLRSDPCVIHGYALAIRVKGLTRQQLLNHIQVKWSASSWTAHPNVLAYLDTGYTLLGCGFYDYYNGYGNMAVDSYPANNTACYAEGKDHLESSPGIMYSYVIGIRNSVPGIGNFVNAIQSSLSGYSNWPEAVAAAPYGYALTGGGADTTYYGVGQLLWKNMPTPYGTWAAGSKDHLESDPGYVRSYAIGLRVIP